MTRRGHVWVDTAVSSVGSSSHLRRSVDLNVAYEELLHIKTLNVSVRFGIAEEVQQIFGRFCWPSALSPLVGFALGFAAYAAVEAPERNNLLLCNNIL